MKNKKTHKILTLMLLITVFVGNNSCKSTKSIAQIEPQTETLSSNLKVTFTQDNQTSGITLDGQMRIIKGQAIQLSVRMPFIGTEAAKVVITPDNILIIDRLHKAYAYEPISEVYQLFSVDLDYYDLETQLFQTQDNMSFKLQKSDVDVKFLTADKGAQFTIDATPPNPEKHTQVTLEQLTELFKKAL
ncbi:hypothetical protein AGMMS49525_12440 [Bacteroidia bacterium]|nr:hypothetical protein AGMMS49525_12440 [Bacteroidia bacterium]